MKSAVLCGLLALAMGATIQDKLSLKAGDTTGVTSTSNKQLTAGGRLDGGQEFVSGASSLKMQTDGNLAFSYEWVQLWSTNTSGHPGAYAIMQTDGNFVVYQGYTALWASNTAGISGAYLWIDDLDNLVIYSSAGVVVWSRRYGKLVAGDILSPGLGVTSLDGGTTLTTEYGGGLTVSSKGQKLWTNNVQNTIASHAIVHTDGRFITFNDHNTVMAGMNVWTLWSAGTNGVSGAYLQVQNDTNVVLYSAGGAAAWSWKSGLMIISGSVSILHSGVKLAASMCLISPDGHTSLQMQTDGNLVVYHDGTALWASDTWGNSGVYLNIQSDGNLVISNGNSAKWATNIFGGSDAYLQIKDDTDLVLYIPGGGAVWSRKNGRPGSTLQSGAKLQSPNCLISPDGHTILAMQTDGNLVIYNNGHVNWSTGTYGNPGAYVTMQPDGNLVVYQGSKALWATATDRKNGAYLRLQDDQNLVVYDKNGSPSYWTPSTGRQY